MYHRQEKINVNISILIFKQSPYIFLTRRLNLIVNLYYSLFRPKKAQLIKVHMPINATLSNENQLYNEDSSPLNDSYDREENVSDKEAAQDSYRNDFKQ